MHDSAFRWGTAFLDSYWNDEMTQILEIGAMDFNGSLRTKKPSNAEWLGVDLEDGPGVDVVVDFGKPLPFASNTFDLVIATSVLEHDPRFWETILELSRVVKPTGFIYINSPSNGAFHRYPFDYFRFYPDAGVAFLDLVRTNKPLATLRESFISNTDPDGWNDFVAIFSASGETQNQYVSDREPVSNLWLNNEFRESTHWDTGSLGQGDKFLKQECENLRAELTRLKETHEQIINSRTWRYSQWITQRLLAFKQGNIKTRSLD